MSVLSDLLILTEDQILRMVESGIQGVSQIGLYFLEFSRSGRQVIEPGAKLAASLMATSGLNDLRMPWSDFAIRVPEKLLFMSTSEFGEQSVSMVFAHQNSEGGVNIQAMTETGAECRQWYPSLGEPVEFSCIDPTLEWQLSVEFTKDDHRLLELCRRLISGCIVELDGGMVVHPKAGLGRAKPNGKPRFSVHRLMRPVVHDVRREVTAYCRGEGRSPTVRTMVRGHWKRQPHGPGRTERKWIHVEPFWRGPEDGPIAIRPHRFAEVS